MVKVKTIHALNTDLHFHPSFCHQAALPRWSEKKVPTMRELITEAVKKRIDMFTITSCSDANMRDPRWEEFLCTGIEVPDYNVRLLCIDENHVSALAYTSKHNPDRKIYVIRGQQFKTDGPDVNVVFAKTEVPIRASKKKPGVVDFRYLLDAARDCGYNVLIAIDKGIDDASLKPLHAWEKIDCIEYETPVPGVPRLAVSNGHELEDLGNSYTRFVYDKNVRTYSGLKEVIKEHVRDNSFIPFYRDLGFGSKVRAGLRLGEELIRSSFTR